MNTEIYNMKTNESVWVESAALARLALGGEWFAIMPGSWLVYHGDSSPDADPSYSVFEDNR